jgi:hypothetical protein
MQKPMILHKKIKLTNKFHRNLYFYDSYFEKFVDYKFCGPDYYINFELSIIQNSENEINIFYDEISDSKDAIPYISEGIELFLSFLKSMNISLSNGLNFTITNTKNHSVDFKPKMFIAFTFKRLKKIFFEYSEKNIEKPILDLTNSFNENAKIIDKIPLECYDSSNYEMRSTIDLPIIYTSELVFPKNKLRKIFSDSENKFKIELIINPHFQNEREDLKRMHYVSILSSFSKESIETYISVKETFELVVKEIYDKKYNLFGIDIYINILSYDSSYSKYATIGFKYDLYYFIKELLLRSNNISQL